MTSGGVPLLMACSVSCSFFAPTVFTVIQGYCLWKSAMIELRVFSSRPEKCTHIVSVTGVCGTFELFVTGSSEEEESPPPAVQAAATSIVAATPISRRRIVPPPFGLRNRVPEHILISSGAYEQSILRGLQRGCDRAVQRCLFSERGDLDPRLERRERDELPSDRLEQQVAVASDAAAEDDELRIHDGHDGGDGERDALRHLRNDRQRGVIALSRRGEDGLRRSRRRHADPLRDVHDPG